MTFVKFEEVSAYHYSPVWVMVCKMLWLKEATNHVH